MAPMGWHVLAGLIRRASLELYVAGVALSIKFSSTWNARLVPMMDCRMQD
jgi:hypothetical protein